MNVPLELLQRRPIAEEIASGTKKSFQQSEASPRPLFAARTLLSSALLLLELFESLLQRVCRALLAILVFGIAERFEGGFCLLHRVGFGARGWQPCNT